MENVVNMTNGDTLRCLLEPTRIREIRIERENEGSVVVRTMPPRLFALVDESSLAELKAMEEYFRAYPRRASRYRTWKAAQEMVG